MPIEVGDAGRRTVLGEVGRSGHQQARQRRCQLHSDHARLQGVGQADAGIQSFPDDIHQLVLVANLQLHLRVASHELVEHRCDHQVLRQVQGADAQLPGGFREAFAERFAGAHQVAVGLFGLFVVALPGLAQADPAGGAVEQLETQLGFQLVDRLAHRCRRHPEQGGGAGEAAGVGDLPEDVQAGEGIASIHC